MNLIGIDIGSTCTKAAVLDENHRVQKLLVIPTGWSSFQALETLEALLEKDGFTKENAQIVSTGYGRKAVEYARRKVTEITCHAKGAVYLYGKDTINVIDIGGQDTKVISVDQGRVDEFYMNDKCSAGTGKFVEIMSNRLNLPVEQLSSYAQRHTRELKISSMCTVFAETEIVSMIGQGESRENIAWGILNSIAVKVKQEYNKLSNPDHPVFLTGGLCENDFLVELLSQQLGREVRTVPEGRYAGAIGAALLS